MVKVKFSKTKMIPWPFPLWKILVCVETAYIFLLNLHQMIGRRVSVIAKMVASPQSSSTLIFGPTVVPWVSCRFQSGFMFVRKIFSSSFVINVIRVQFNLVFICPHLQYQWTIHFSPTLEQTLLHQQLKDYHSRAAPLVPSGHQSQQAIQ